MCEQSSLIGRCVGSRIDEVHTLVGAGAVGRSGGSGLDISNLLKPPLARGELQCIGATTLGGALYLYQLMLTDCVDEPFDCHVSLFVKGIPSFGEAKLFQHGLKTDTIHLSMRTCVWLCCKCVP
jgi:hypothetical protein